MSTHILGFQNKKPRPFLKLENIPDLLNNDNEGQIIDDKNRLSFWGNIRLGAIFYSIKK